MNVINFNMNIIKESLMPGPSSATAYKDFSE